MVGSVAEFPTESAAMKSSVVQAILLQINASKNTGSTPLFRQVIARYEKEELPERYSTRSAYLSIIKTYIRPRWAAVLLTAIRSMEVESWLKGLTLASKTKSHIKGLMHTMFECARRWELIEGNPIALVRVKGGSKRQKQPHILTPDEFRKLAASIAEPYRTMVLVAGHLGLRASELMALQWGDFDFDNGTVLIQRSIVHGRVGEVKTEYSKEVVPVDQTLQKVLANHRLDVVPTPEGWLFANPLTSRPYHQDQIQKTHLQRAAKLAGINGRIGWHTFRHTFRSWLDDTGAPVTVQQELMRHASALTTLNVYGRAMTDTKRHAQMLIASKLSVGFSASPVS